MNPQGFVVTHAREVHCKVGAVNPAARRGHSQ
jgi:hypothetical protein